MRKEWLLWVHFCNELKQTVFNSWYVETMGIRPSLEITFKDQNFLEILTSVAHFRLIDNDVCFSTTQIRVYFSTT